jgi:hypothetical protein
MRNPLLLNWLLGLANVLLMAGIFSLFRVFRLVKVMRIYVRQICGKLEIDCGKDLD